MLTPDLDAYEITRSYYQLIAATNGYYLLVAANLLNELYRKLTNESALVIN